MKQIRIMSLVVLLSGLQAVSAQTTVSGTVVDKEGKPVQGALVEVKGSSDKITTDFEGGFSLESNKPIKKVSARYVGLNAKVQRAEEGMVVKLTEENWWNRKPEHGYWFAGLQGLKPESGFKGATPGVMGGYMFRRGFGLYLKWFNFMGSTNSDYYSSESWRMDYWFTGESKHLYMGGLAGVIFRIHGPLHIYAGAGFMERLIKWELYGGEWCEMEDFSFSNLDVNVVLDLGVMLKVGSVLVNGGVIYHDPYEFDGFTSDFELKNQLMLNVGVSYCF